jgi:hypothetical protein
MIKLIKEDYANSSKTGVCVRPVINTTKLESYLYQILPDKIENFELDKIDITEQDNNWDYALYSIWITYYSTDYTIESNGDYDPDVINYLLQIEVSESGIDFTLSYDVDVDLLKKSVGVNDITSVVNDIKNTILKDFKERK